MKKKNRMCSERKHLGLLALKTTTRLTSIDDSSGLSKPEWQPFQAWQQCKCCTFPQIHHWCDTCWSLGDRHCSRADLFHISGSRHWLGSKPGSMSSKLTLYSFCFCLYYLSTVKQTRFNVDVNITAHSKASPFQTEHLRCPNIPSVLVWPWSLILRDISNNINEQNKSAKL